MLRQLSSVRNVTFHYMSTASRKVFMKLSKIIFHFYPFKIFLSLLAGYLVVDIILVSIRWEYCTGCTKKHRPEHKIESNSFQDTFTILFRYKLRKKFNIHSFEVYQLFLTISMNPHSLIMWNDFMNE